MSLTLKERVIGQIQHRETDYVPYTLSFNEGDVADRLDDYYGDDNWRSFIDNAIRRVPIPTIGLVVDLQAGTCFTDLYGSRWQVDIQPHRLIETPLKKPSLDGFKWPDIEECFDPDWEERARQQVEEQKDYFMIGHIGSGPFERSWMLRGFTEAMMDAAAYPDFYDELVEQVVNHQMAIIERVLELPVDGIMFDDDWSYQQGVLLGPDRWRRVLKPRLAQIYAFIHAAGKYTLTHCCGSIEEILPDLIEIGLDVYQGVQPEAKNNNPYELKRKYGDKITFWGGLGSQSTIPLGTPNEIRVEVARLCREMGRGGGYILSPAISVPPETPTENAAAVLEAFLQQTGVPFPWQ